MAVGCRGDSQTKHVSRVPRHHPFFVRRHDPDLDLAVGDIDPSFARAAIGLVNLDAKPAAALAR